MSAVDRPLFIAQDKLTQWEGEGKVKVDGNILTLLAERRTYTLVDAVRFMKVEGGDADAHGLLGKVRTKDQLKTLGAEHYMESVIMADTAYQVQQGYVGSILMDRTVTMTGVAAPAAQPAAAPVAPPVAPPPAAAKAPAQAAVPPASHPPATRPAAPTTPASAAKATTTSPSISEALGGNKPRSDADLLADFLMDNLAS